MATKPKSGAKGSGSKSKAKTTKGALDPANLPHATVPKGGQPVVLNWNDENGDPQTTSIFDVVMAYDPKVHGPWRAEKGKGKHNGGFYNGDIVGGCLDRKLTVNETGLTLLTSGSASDIAASISAFTQTWVIVSGRWTPDSGYGFQHFTQYGHMNFAGLDRLSSVGIAMNAATAIEALAQRAAMKSLVTSEADQTACAEAENLLKGLSEFGKSRPAQVKAATRQRAYAAIAGEGGKVLEPKATSAA